MLGLIGKIFRQKPSKTVLDKPIRHLDFMSKREINSFQVDRTHEILVLLKYGHASDLPGYDDLDRSNPEAVTEWIIGLTLEPLAEDIRPQLIAAANKYKQQERAIEPSG